jgi:hypothetical protein
MGAAGMDHILHMQVGITNQFMKRHNMSPQEFLELDREVDILGFIETGYDVFHLMGDKGILAEIDRYVDGKKS